MTRILKSHCSKGHELTPDNLDPKRLPRRACLKCKNAFFGSGRYSFDPNGDDWSRYDD